MVVVTNLVVRPRQVHSVSDHGIVILGIVVPSSSKVFLTIVAGHVGAGLVCVVAGAVAMVSPKRAGRHPTAGTLYYWSLLVVFLSMTALSIMRWPADTHLLVLGILSFGSGAIGRTARRGRWQGWLRIHMVGMGLSYILLLTAFYVDNGPFLPLWRSLPAAAYWLGPSMVGLPILVRALLRHPLLVRRTSA
jgi:hypothetical protein